MAATLIHSLQLLQSGYGGMMKVLGSKLTIALAPLLLLQPFPSNSRGLGIRTLYVNSDGDNRNDGRSAQRPLRTPEQAIEAVRKRPGKAIIYLKGTFVIENPIQIDKTAEGTVWTTLAPASTSFQAFHSAPAAVIVNGADDVTISDLTFRGFTKNAILIEGGRRARVLGNRVYDTKSTGWSQAAIHLRGLTAGSKVVGNLVERADYAGILVDTYGLADISGIRIVGNDLLSTCQKVSDCGAIHVNDRARISKDVVIEGNRIRDFGPVELNARGIYLDDWASNVTVRRNDISGPGGFAFQIHGGSNNLITLNKVNLEKIGTFLLYQRVSKLPEDAMVGNKFSENVITALRIHDALSTHPLDLRTEGMPIIHNNSFCVVGGRCDRH